MRPSHIAKAIHECLNSKQPVFIWGSPGVGKSDTVKQIGRERGIQVADGLRLSLLDPVDLRGFPYMKDGQMHFAPPVTLPTDPDSEGILFLDEMNSGLPATQAAAYQLVLDRRIGEYRLPDKWHIVAAGNRESDQGVTYTMPAPLANRFTHLDYDVHFDDWRAWAFNNNIRQDIISFINFQPGLLNDFDPDKKAFPTPRSWAYVSKLLNKDLMPEIERGLISGSVGEGAAASLSAFLKIRRNLPDPDAVLMNPKAAQVPTDPATLYALCGALSERASETNFDRLVEYCLRMSPEFQVLCIRDSVSRNKALTETGAFTQWAIKNASVLI